MPGAELDFIKHLRWEKSEQGQKLVRECRPDIARLHIADMRG
jgi:hypothetical protein